MKPAGGARRDVGVAQLPLGITLDPPRTFAAYVPGPNRELTGILEAVAGGTSPVTGPVLIWGPQGSGRTHLLEACCDAAGRAGRAAALVPLELPGLAPIALGGFGELALVAVDDLQAVAGQADWEEALFHLHNAIEAAGGRLVVSAVGPPGSLGLILPDLVSRLAGGLVLRLAPLGDEERLEAVRRMAARRGLEMSEEVAAYVLRRHRRDLHALEALVERVDRASLAAQRPISLPLVRELLRDGEREASS